MTSSSPGQQDVILPLNAVMSSTLDAVTSSTLDAAERSRSRRPLKEHYERDTETEKSHFNNLTLVNNDNL